MNDLKSLAGEGSGTERLPPYSKEAEMGVLGCVLVCYDNSAEASAVMDQCIERFGAAGSSWFYDARHLEIWKCMACLHGDRKAVEHLLIQDFLKTFDKLDAIGGSAYLNEIQDSVPSAQNISYYLDILHEKFLARRALKIAAQITNAIYHPAEGETGIKDAISRMEADVLELTADHAGVKEQSAAEGAVVLAETIDKMKRGEGMVSGLKTGFEYFDRLTTGLHRGEMFLLGGRPGTGKTALAMSIAEHVSKGPDGVGVGVFSLEMKKEAIWARLCWQKSGADFQRFRTGGFTTNDEVPGISQALAEMPDHKIWVDDTPALTIGDLRARARRMKREHNIRLWIIDYFTLLQPDRRSRDQRADFDEIARGLQGMKKELGDSVIILSQLNRESEKEKRKPKMSDFKETSQLEQDADLAGILYEPKLRDQPFDDVGQSERDLFEPGAGAWFTHKKRVNLEVCKQRNGATGPVELVFLTKSMAFTEFDRAECRSAPRSQKSSAEQWEE